jgi:hypothetical protein
MTLVEVLELVYLRTDEDFSDRDDTLDKLMKFGINQAYKQIRTTVDKRTTEADIAYAEKIDIPTDFFEMIQLSQGTALLSELDYDIVADKLLMKNQTITAGSLHLFYVNVPGNLSNDTDVVDLRDIYKDALTSYASYVYLLATGKAEIANIYLKEYLSIVSTGKEAKQ